MSLSARDIEQVTNAVVDRLARERRARAIRVLKWAIPTMGLLIAAAALILEVL